jgi:prolyl oligopeptidase
LIAVDTRHPERANWKTIVPEKPETLTSANVVNDTFILGYLKDARTEVHVHDLAGKFLRNVDLPGIGTAEGFGGKRKDKETFYAFTSFVTPTTIYRYDPVAGKSSVFRQAKVDFDPGQYETKQIFYNSKDGTRVPMFLTYKKGLKLDGQNPVLLYAYGGFNISLTPAFSVGNLVWLEMGGVYAQPNLRGGGEYGEDWHQAGTKLHKQNVFDDFIAAAEWLIANHYTSPAKLAIRGGSNGGLLVGACLTQRPDLFGAALPAVGVMDMLRFHKFTIGWAWTSDYGSSDDPEQFKALYAYSPLHNLRAGTKYPPTLITTADHDDRVVPGHSFKFAATLQADQAGPAPVLIRIETKAGHGAGKPVSKQIEELADVWAFAAHSLGMDVALK